MRPIAADSHGQNCGRLEGAHPFATVADTTSPE
jgi:hypothetical protein